MNRNDIFDAVGKADDEMLQRSENHRRPSRFPRIVGVIAAVLVLAFVGSSLLSGAPDGSGLPSALKAAALAAAEYPAAVPFPDSEAEDADEQFDAWFEDIRARADSGPYPAALTPFLRTGMQQFLTDTGGENALFSPASLYFALGMLAEVTDGESRTQILELLGAENIEQLRTQSHDLWNRHYRADGAVSTVFADSLWINEQLDFNAQTLDTLAKNYYASSFAGAFGTEAFDEMLHSWIAEQTGNLLADSAKSLRTRPEDVMTLVSTVFMKARWMDEFSKENTAPATFHAPSGDKTCDFMHRSDSETYYWGDHFGAVCLPLDARGGTVCLLLPDESVSPEALLTDENALAFLLAANKSDAWADNSRNLIVNFAMPKFDVSSSLDLGEGLRKMGVTAVFDPAAADFSPLSDNADGIALSGAKHAVRVAVDEEGLTAAAYTALAMAGSGMPPEETIDFTLDRPFLFAVTAPDGLPLFVGVVNKP